MGYGLSETASTANMVLRPWEEFKALLSTTGIPLPGIQLKVIDVEGSGKSMSCPRSTQTHACICSMIMPSPALKYGESGELLIRSASLMNCYLDNPTTTAECLDEDGWFHTGDIGKVDKNNNVWITDRLKEVTLIGLEPAEEVNIDQVLYYRSSK